MKVILLVVFASTAFIGIAYADQMTGTIVSMTLKSNALTSDDKRFHLPQGIDDTSPASLNT